MPAESMDCGLDATGVRADLHCHSNASSEAGEAVLGAINCPESFSDPHDVYAQAKSRGMDFVTITDHDSIAGVERLALRPDVLSGEEVTCYFPEDRCKMHVLVWGITREDHDALQQTAHDIYDVARYIEGRRIAHAVAHPLYRQNDKLERWHVERLLLMFKGFEVLNGSHSLLHREAFEPLLDELTPSRIEELSRKHAIEPRWPQPWMKARTGGSDDHGLLNVGRTWTRFPADTRSIDQLLECLRQGRCAAGGEAGSSLKLAHNFYSIAIRYSSRRLAGGGNATLLRAMTGEQRLRKRDLVKVAVCSTVGAIGRRIRRPFCSRLRRASGSQLLSSLLVKSARRRLTSSPTLRLSLREGRSPLAEHEAMFAMIRGLDADATRGIVDSVAAALAEGRIGPVFDALSAVAGQQFFLLPYYFSLFHQNRERHVFGRVTGRDRTPSSERLKLGVFTDAFDQTRGAGRLVRMLGAEAASAGRSLLVHTCSATASHEARWRKNFAPLATIPMPGDASLSVALPPLAQIMEWADRQQFDAIHVHTPGPIGLCGMLVASMLRVPLLATYHTDLPAYVHDNTGDHRLTAAAESFQRWFYGRPDRVLCRSRWDEERLPAAGIAADKLCVLPPCVDTQLFHPRYRDVCVWADRRVSQPFRLLYSGRVGPEKNLELLAEVFERLCRHRRDVALIVAGDGPGLPGLRQRLGELPAYFPGRQDDAQLATLYASSDLLLFPSRTDTQGQVVLEAQACGLPVLVGDRAGAREAMDDAVTGLVLPADDADRWAAQIDALLNDEPRRQRMARTASQRVARCSPARTFDAYWEQHVRAAREAAARHASAVPSPSQSRPASRSHVLPFTEELSR